jgi:hypothetical protein
MDGSSSALARGSALSVMLPVNASAVFDIASNMAPRACMTGCSGGASTGVSTVSTGAGWQAASASTAPIAKSRISARCCR